MMTESDNTKIAIATPEEEAASPAPAEEPEEVDWNFSRGMLSGACKDLTEIPSDLGDTYGARTIQLDLSFNSIRSVSHLEKFTKLKTLILDNNAISDGATFELPPSVRILSVNNNNINDVASFLEGLSAVKNTLAQISLLKNPGCPSPYFGSDTDDYARFRLYVVYMLPKLEYLDSTKVTDHERSEARRRGAFLRPARLIQTSESSAGNGEGSSGERGNGGGDAGVDGNGNGGYGKTTALPQDLAEPGSSGPARFGVCSYVYYGKQSEGNRFILNDDL